MLSTAPKETPLDEELSACRAEARKREILAITPRGLETVADQCILDELDVAQARQRLLEAHTKAREPVGTTEPEQIVSGATERANADEPQLKDVSDREFARSLSG